ncbi:MAG: FMN-binding glutamate synthase family protein [Hyphomicrobiaceae bacterium]
MRDLLVALKPRFLLLTLSVLITIALLVLAIVEPAPAGAVLIPLFFVGSIAIIGLHDVIQTKHSILRNYPILAHMRFIFEDLRPAFRQYFFEGDKDGAPFGRDKRAIVYQRAKRALDKRPFGTQYDVYADRYEWLVHSIAPMPIATAPFTITIGGPECREPYQASVFNISGMSYGALSANAIRSLNRGAKLGGFAHDTGEGSVSPHHLEFGGDLVWQIGSGYFGCRTADGKFCPDRFERTASLPQVKLIEIKLSQGAKPGHGGVLPGAKVTPEIGAIRGIPEGLDCISPAQHSAFSTPLELIGFIDQLRRLSGEKPVGIKLCLGHRHEFLAIVKAMLQTGQAPDFIVVDGKEGGTGAAPLEFMDHLGTPLRDALVFVHSALVGANLRDRIKLGASGKIVTAFDMARVMSLGADWCNSARGFMFAVGCIQAQQCHTGRCPTGVATQDIARQRAIVVPDKSERVASFHRETLNALAELVSACGLAHPCELNPMHLMLRCAPDRISSFAEHYDFLKPGELLAGGGSKLYRDAWNLAQAASFAPAAAVNGAEHGRARGVASSSTG